MSPDSNAATNLWRHTLEQIPSVFGRLSYLASLRNLNSGRYEHFGLAQRFDPGEADRVLRESHTQVFNQWLAFGLQDQKQDLEEYLNSLETELAEVIANWIRVAPYRNCVPAEIRPVERELFLADFERILEMLRYEHAVVSPDPDA